MKQRINEKEKALLEKFMPKDKVGIRVLNDTQLENVFPSCSSLLKRIEKHRDNISNISDLEYTDRNYQFDMMYDNVFSIFGKRGSGKTSTLLTLKMILKSQNQYDLILPLIIPDVIPENENILSWLMAILEDEVINLETKLAQIAKNSPKNDGFFKDCRVRENNSLRNKYENIKKMIYSKKFRPETSASYYEALGGAEITSRNSYAFSKSLSQFWYEMINVIKQLEKSNGEDIVPLIFIMFDDVDLSPERAEELLSTIIKYLSHPNIIVITTADEELFLKVVENNFKYKLKSPSTFQNYDNVKKVVRQVLEEIFYSDDFAEDDGKREDTMAKMYLDKVLPPSARYFLNTFSKWSDKSEFLLGFEKESDNLSTMISWLIAGFLSSLKIIKRENETFLYYNHKFLKFYVSFFGKTSRQIQNQWIILCEFINSTITLVNSRPKNQNEYRHKMYYIVCEFLHNSINTNSELKNEIDDINDFVNHIFHWEYSGYPFYVDYNYINEKLQEESRGKIDDKSEIRHQIINTIPLLALCSFTENILLILDNKEATRISKRRYHLHLGKTLENFFKWVTENGQLVKKYDNSEYMLFIYEEFLEAPDAFINFNPYNGKSVRNILMKLDLKLDPNSRFFENMKSDMDTEWEYYKTYAFIIFMLYNDMYCIDEFFLHKTSFVEEVFEFPSYCTIDLNMIYSEMIYNLVTEKFNTSKAALPVTYHVKNMNDDMYYTLSDALNKTQPKDMSAFESSTGYETEVRRLKELVNQISYYYIIDLEKYNKTIASIEEFYKDKPIIFGRNLINILSEMKGKTEASRTLEKKTLREFKKEMENLNQRYEKRFSSNSYQLVRDICTNVDLAVSYEQKANILKCAEQINTIMSMLKNHFTENLEKEKNSSINSAGFYKNEILNKDNIASEHWYHKLVEEFEKNSRFKDDIFREVEDYILEKMEKDADDYE